jgi:hypothetical protein
VTVGLENVHNGAGQRAFSAAPARQGEIPLFLLSGNSSLYVPVGSGTIPVILKVFVVHGGTGTSESRIVFVQRITLC